MTAPSVCLRIALAATLGAATWSAPNAGEVDGPRLLAATQPKAAPAAAQPKAAPAAAKPDPKGKNRASVVLDRNCPVVVKPFEVSDSAAEVGRAMTTGLVGTVTGWLGRVVGGGNATLGAGDALTAGKLAAKHANWMPMEAEVAYGERQHAQQEDDIVDRTTKPGQRVYPTADRMLAEILAAVPEPHAYQFRLFVMKTSSRNALALPGGFVYVDSGLLSDPAFRPKAYFAIAHEIAHVLQRHETMELQSNAIDTVTSGTELIGLLRNVGSNPNAVVDHVQIEKNRFTQHHVDEELQADSCAARLLARTLPDAALAESLRTFLADLPPVDPVTPPAAPPTNNAERLAQSVDQIVDTPVKRHPTSAERTANLREMYAEVTSASAKAR